MSGAREPPQNPPASGAPAASGDSAGGSSPELELEPGEVHMRRDASGAWSFSVNDEAAPAAEAAAAGVPESAALEIAASHSAEPPAAAAPPPAPRSSSLRNGRKPSSFDEYSQQVMHALEQDVKARAALLDLHLKTAESVSDGAPPVALDGAAVAAKKPLDTMDTYGLLMQHADVAKQRITRLRSRHRRGSS